MLVEFASNMIAIKIVNISALHEVIKYFSIHSQLKFRFIYISTSSCQRQLLSNISDEHLTIWTAQYSPL